MAQPSKFTADRRALILAALHVGCSDETAAWHAGVNKSTLSRWLERAEHAADGGTWNEFWLRVCEAKAGSRLSVVGAAFKAAVSPDRDGTLAWKMAQRMEPAFRPIETEPRPIGPTVIVLELPSMPKRPSSTTIQQLPAG